MKASILFGGYMRHVPCPTQAPLTVASKRAWMHLQSELELKRWCSEEIVPHGKMPKRETQVGDFKLFGR